MPIQICRLYNNVAIGSEVRVKNEKKANNWKNIFIIYIFFSMYEWKNGSNCQE